MKRFLLVILALLALSGCDEKPVDKQVEPAAGPVITPASRIFLPVVEDPASTPQAFLPVVAGQSGECATHTAALSLSTSAATLRVGQAVTVTVTLANQGCAALGLPQYRLAIQPGGERAILDPPAPEPVAHSLGLSNGQADSAQFVLRAIAAGQATLNATASFEAHLGYPGPAYWGNAATAPIVITVTQ